jgi:hypothetical protein
MVCVVSVVGVHLQLRVWIAMVEKAEANDQENRALRQASPEHPREENDPDCRNTLGSTTTNRVPHVICAWRRTRVECSKFTHLYIYAIVVFLLHSNMISRATSTQKRQ